MVRAEPRRSRYRWIEKLKSRDPSHLLGALPGQSMEKVLARFVLRLAPTAANDAGRITSNVGINMLHRALIL